MARKRKRDWPQRVYKYAVTQAHIPQEMWEQAKRMQALWNQLCELHAGVRASINNETAEDERKAKWEAFNESARIACRDSRLSQECDTDVLDRFTKACVAAAKDPSRGWPRPRALAVSIRHRYTGGGVPLTSLTSLRANRVRIDAHIAFDSSDRPRHAARQGKDSRYRRGQFQLNNGELILFTCQVHEPINPHAIVKSVRWVGRRSNAFGWSWWIIVQTEEPAVSRVQTQRECGIDVGWRKRGVEAIRVAYLVDDAGESREILLPLDFSTRDLRRQKERHPEWEHPPQTHAEIRELQSKRDGELEALKANLKSLFSPLPPGFEKMRGRGLIRLMRELPDDSVAKGVIKSWMQADMGPYLALARASERFANRRREAYRIIAAEIAEKYDVINIEKCEIAHMISDDDRQEPKSHSLQAADRYHQIAATYDFVQCVKTAAKKRGAKVYMKASANTSAVCSVCGGVMSIGHELFQRCENGHEIDQDENAARNILSQTFPVYVRKTELRKIGAVRSSKAVVTQ